MGFYVTQDEFRMFLTSNSIPPRYRVWWGKLSSTIRLSEFVPTCEDSSTRSKTYSSSHDSVELHDAREHQTIISLFRDLTPPCDEILDERGRLVLDWGGGGDGKNSSKSWSMSFGSPFPCSMAFTLFIDLNLVKSVLNSLGTIIFSLPWWALHRVPIPMHVPMPTHAHGFWVGMGAKSFFMGGHGWQRTAFYLSDPIKNLV